MRSSLCVFSVVLLLALATPCLAASSFHNALSLQGFTGLLNTPNALTTEEGKIYFGYSDQKESIWRERTKSQDNILMSLGLFDFIELGGRFFEAPRVGRDLSGNFKVRIPFLPKLDYVPSIAFGMQDVGGGTRARYLQTKYVVASEELWRFRFSVGYGTGPDRMDGVFGGIELKACDWVYLLAEHDTSERNVGARFVTPHLFGYPINIQATAKTSLDHNPGHFEYAVGLQIPLGLDHNYSKPIPAAVVANEPPQVVPAAPAAASPASASPAAASSTDASPATAPATAPAAAAPAVTAPATPPRALPPARLLKRLTDDGFQNVRVGAGGSILVVEYENSRYNHNELDGLGVVAGIVQREAPSQFDTLRLVEKKKGIRMLQLEMPLKELREFFQDAYNRKAFESSLKITSEIGGDQGVEYLAGDENSSYLSATLMIYPGLKTYLGTEVGAYDYLLSLKPDLYLNLWKGAALNARADIPLAWSDNFEDGKMFRPQRSDARLDRLMLFQAIKPSSTVMAVLGGGMVVAENYGTLNELLWTPGDGTHHFKASQLYTNNNERTNKRESYLGSYRFHYAPLDLYLQGTGGKFYTQDRGAVVELKRFIGDTAVTVFYKNSVATDGRNHQAAGIQFDLPLTLRRDMKPYPLQVRGTDDWSFAQETSIAKKGKLNYIGTPIGSRVEPAFNGDRMFYNRDRLNEPYIRQHLLRLRDAYLKYVVED